MKLHLSFILVETNCKSLAIQHNTLRQILESLCQQVCFGWVSIMVYLVGVVEFFLMQSSAKMNSLRTTRRLVAFDYTTYGWLVSVISIVNCDYLLCASW